MGGKKAQRAARRRAEAMTRDDNNPTLRDEAMARRAPELFDRAMGVVKLGEALVDVVASLIENPLTPEEMKDALCDVQQDLDASLHRQQAMAAGFGLAMFGIQLTAPSDEGVSADQSSEPRGERADESDAQPDAE